MVIELFLQRQSIFLFSITRNVSRRCGDKFTGLLRYHSYHLNYNKAPMASPNCVAKSLNDFFTASLSKDDQDKVNQLLMDYFTADNAENDGKSTLM